MRTEFSPLTDSDWQFISKFLDTQRKRKYDLRVVFNAILWLNKTGIQWRELKETSYPKWQIVYYYFRIWKEKGVFFSILREVVRIERLRQKHQAEPSVAAIDSQSVKKGMFVSENTEIDGNKRVNGRVLTPYAATILDWR